MVGWQVQVVSWCQPWIDPWCSPKFNTIYKDTHRFKNTLQVKRFWGFINPGLAVVRIDIGDGCEPIKVSICSFHTLQMLVKSHILYFSIPWCPLHILFPLSLAQWQGNATTGAEESAWSRQGGGYELQPWRITTKNGLTCGILISLTSHFSQKTMVHSEMFCVCAVFVFQKKHQMSPKLNGELSRNCRDLSRIAAICKMIKISMFYKK